MSSGASKLNVEVGFRSRPVKVIPWPRHDDDLTTPDELDRNCYRGTVNDSSCRKVNLVFLRLVRYIKKYLVLALIFHSHGSWYPIDRLRFI
jgi:hypothetical protein